MGETSGALTEPQSKRLRVNGINLHYWDWPSDGPPIILLHSSGNYARIWEWVAQRLNPQYRVLAPDQRGHGDTEEPPSGNAAEDYAEDVEAFAQALGLERFVLGGRSLGVRVAMVYAARSPQRVKALIFVGGPHFSTIHPGADVEHWQRSVSTMRVRPRRVPSLDAAREVLRASYPHFSDAMLDHALRYNTNLLPDGAVEWKFNPPWVADGLTHALDDLRGYAEQITCPVLNIRPENSWELTPERMPEVERLFKSGQTVTIAGGTGSLELEKPAEVADAMLAFLARVQA